MTDEQLLAALADLGPEQRRGVLARWAVAISEIDYDLRRWRADLGRWQRRDQPFTIMASEDFELRSGQSATRTTNATFGDGTVVWRNGPWRKP